MWWWGEDIRDNQKPAWNTNSSSFSVAWQRGKPVSSDSIFFHVNIGGRRRLMLSFLSSKSSSMGIVKATLASSRGGPPLDSWTINSQWKLPFSVTKVDFHDVVTTVRDGPHLLELALLPHPSRSFTRFKLMSVRSC